MSAALRSCARRWLLAALLLSACGEERPLTQIVVVIDSDIAGLQLIRAEVSGFEEPKTVTIELDEDRELPRYFTMVHDGGELGPMGVTVRAYTDRDAEPILVEPRTELFFVAGQTRALHIDLLLECIGDCGVGLACLGDGECVPSDDAGELVPWQGPPPDGLDPVGAYDAGMDASFEAGIDASDDGMVSGEGGFEDGGPDAEPPVEDARTNDADDEVDAGPDADTIDAEIDAGPTDPTWTYVPSNVDLEGTDIDALERIDLVIACDDAVIDSSDPSASSVCGEALPAMEVVTQLDSADDALVVVLSSLAIESGAKLSVRGSRPVILLVEGDAAIAGALDASAAGAVPGPGADRHCEAGRGATGGNGNPTQLGGSGSSGGGGGGFGSRGSDSGGSNSVDGVLGGALAGSTTLRPLRGGCSGGAGGTGEGPVAGGAAGGGGGAVQLSVLGTLSITTTGTLSASGGGGGPSAGLQGGGGGGGSGGAILLEAQTFEIAPLAVFAVNGGGGGGGQPTAASGGMSTAGGDGLPSFTPASAGTGAGTGGDGAEGAAFGAPAAQAQAGSSTVCSAGTCYGAGGGGGGGVGVIRLRGTTTCAPDGLYSPAPLVECEACGTCPAAPDLSCVARESDDALYAVCSAALPWQTARARCQAVGMDLAKIEAEPENSFLLAQIPVAGEYWIGATDELDEDEWLWIDDSQFWQGDETGESFGGAFEAWRSSEPNGDDCARIMAEGWADADCLDDYPFLCEL